MRAVFFCSTSASTVTRSTSTFTTSVGSAGILPALSLFDFDSSCELTLLSRVCDVTDRSEVKNRIGKMNASSAKRRKSVGFRCFISALPFESSVARLGKTLPPAYCLLVFLGRELFGAMLPEYREQRITRVNSVVSNQRRLGLIKC